MAIGVEKECLRKKFSWSKCSLCVEICPTKALSFHQSGVDLDRQKCDQCGLCVLACPVNAISGPIPLRHVENDLLHSDSRAVPLLKELLLYHHAGIRHIHLNESHTCWLPVIEQANATLATLGCPAFEVQQDNQPVEYISSARRSLLGLRRRSPLSIKNVPLNTAFPHYRFYTLSLDKGACSLCEACQNVCPTQCIEIKGGAFTIHTHQCTGCTLCADACPEKAIAVTVNVAPQESLQHPLKKYTCSCCANTYSDFEQKNEENQICSTCKLRKKVGLPTQTISQNSIANLYRGQ